HHQHDHLEHQDLELEELRHPEYPVLVLHKGQHAEQNQYTREDYEGHFHLHRASGIQSSENFLPQNISYICGTSNTPYMMAQAKKAHLGQHIRDMRVLKGMKQETLGNLIGMARQNVSKMGHK